MTTVVNDGTSTGAGRPPVGELLRTWRRRRRLSQLEFSVRADISSRHLSFLETGRSAPSRDMVLHLAEELDLPLRERNRLLVAAGYAPTYPEAVLDAPRMATVRAAVRQVLRGHEPHPALAVDRSWQIVDGNAALAWLTEPVAPWLLAPPANALRISLHPEGLAPHIVNLAQWRAHILARLRRQVELSGDPALAELEDELRGYPGGRTDPPVPAPGPEQIVVPLRVRRGGMELAFFSTTTTFGTPLDITVAELVIESFYPADAATAAAVAHRPDGGRNGHE